MTRAPAEVGSAANSYEILAKLAMGGMAEIFLARGASSAGVERYVVLKRVLAHRADDQHFVKMFLDEARLASQLQHPNVAQVYDIGKLGDSYFFTMEYVHGETVRMLLQRAHGLRRPIPFSSVLSIVAGAAAGLHHAHERKGYDGKPLGIVHRDVSPSNLMISYEGTVKVVDFGVAKAEHRSTETQSGSVKGKIAYMSPEQCKGGEVDRRSDLFSLGIVMWEMLTTERLFRRASDFEAMQAIVSEDVPPPSQLRPDIPPDVDALVMKLLAKSAADRFQTGDELHEAIEAVAVRTGSALSTASLGRYMRELFGQRPEPWIELQTREVLPEAFTVTSEPISSELALSDVLDLSQLAAAQPAQPVIPLRVEADPDLAPTLNLPRERTSSSVPPMGRTSSANLPVMPAIARTSSSNMPAVAAGYSHTPSVGVPQYPVLSSSSAAAYVARASVPNLAAPPPSSRSRLAYIIVPAALLGVIVGIAIAFGGSADEKKKAPVAQLASPPQPAPSKPVFETRAEKPAIERVVDNPVIEKAVDNPVETPAETPAEKPVVEKAVEKPVVEKPVVEKAVDKPTETKRAEPADVAALYKDKQYADVVSACNASKSVLGLNATACTLAACKTKQVSKARRWFASVGAAKKSAVQRECGSILPAEKPDDECKLNPLACQY